jgi:hypothetical protein
MNVVTPGHISLIKSHPYQNSTDYDSFAEAALISNGANLNCFFHTRVCAFAGSMRDKKRLPESNPIQKFDLETEVEERHPIQNQSKYL